ncbi:uncharacterized protein LOC134820762 [Bolinopsis microptera]|uniref:uncharacterized protein LOC134820762 n=1 Tax=Bolinopsis microptera TaxID=2820187 RepID=UPI0030793242
MPFLNVHRRVKVPEMSMEGSTRIAVFNKYSPSITKLWKQKDRLNRYSSKGTQIKLDQEKETAMRALNRTQNLLMKDRGQQSRPVSRASTLWSSQELSCRTRSSKRRPLSARVKSDAVPGEEMGLIETFGTLSVRREATFCRSLNQICNATEREKQSWDHQVIRQQQVSLLDDRSMELIAPTRRKKTTDKLARNQKCKSELLAERGPAPNPLLSSRSLIMTSSIFLTSSQSFQSEVPRYVRLRGEHKSKHGTTCKSSSNDQLTQSSAIKIVKPSPPEKTPPSPEKLLQSPESYNPDEYITTSQEDLCGDLYIQHCPSRRLSKTFSSPDIRRLNSP